MKTYLIRTLGCKVNQYESEAIAHELRKAGIEAVDATLASSTGANVCIVNTCTVTQKASMQSRQVIRQIVRDNPDAIVIVTGCYAQTQPQEILSIAGIDYVISQTDKHHIPQMLADQQLTGQNTPIQIASDQPETNFPIFNEDALGDRTRPFLKIQDGCDAFCSYCIVPYARGRSRSMPVNDVLTGVWAAGAAGFREVVLSGIHLGCYGQDLSRPTTLLQLLNQLSQLGAVDRLRLSSIEPNELTPELIQFAADSNKYPTSICEHFHIPLQSGDDDILKDMRRPYTRDFFNQLIRRIHRLLPEAAIGVDVLVGFPGETEKAFQNTIELIDRLPITYLHVFPFSPRKGTPAATLPDQVDAATIKNRSFRLRHLGKQKKENFFFTVYRSNREGPGRNET